MADTEKRSHGTAQPFVVVFTYEDHPTALSDAVRAFVKLRLLAREREAALPRERTHDS